MGRLSANKGFCKIALSFYHNKESLKGERGAIIGNLRDGSIFLERR